MANEKTVDTAAADLTTGTKVTKATGKPKANKAAANEKGAHKAALKTGTDLKSLPANSKGGKAPAKGKATTKAPAKAAAKSAPKADKPKQKKASAEASRQSYADKKITVLVKPADSGLREGSGRAARYAIIAKAKNTNDVLGKEATDGAGNVSSLSGAHLAFFVANDFIRLD